MTTKKWCTLEEHPSTCHLSNFG